LALVALVSSLGWAIATTTARSAQSLILLPTASLFTLALLLLVTATVVQIVGDRSDNHHAPEGEFLLGCTLGRRTVSCGMLQVREARHRIPRGDHVSPFTECHATRLQVEWKGSSQLYDELAEFILQVLRAAHQRNKNVRCSTIGIATPGIVNPQTGQLTLSVTVPEGADIPHEIARRLIAKGSQELITTFQTNGMSERLLARRIYIDNDIRCIARHELSKHGREQFMCLYAGSGVGGGLVVGGQVYYGVHGSAAHIGHLELGTPTGKLQLLTGQELGPADCDCGKYGFHLEAFASYVGLRRITEAVIQEEEVPALALLKEEYAQAGVGESDFFRDGFPLVIAAAGGRSLDRLPENVRPVVAHNSHLANLTTRVLRAYVGVLAAGIVTITHTFDPGVVVLCGPLVERLRENELFARYLRDCLPPRLLDERAMPHLAAAVSVEALWQGAALVAWDPLYHRLRKVSEH
jgi:predicted NBD/HSP70 family sugar kinase